MRRSPRIALGRGSALPADASAELLGRVTEKEFRQHVKELATLLGWRCYFTWTSIHSPAGWPDLSLCRPPRLILAELKSEHGKLTAAQQRWLELLRQCPGVEVYVWRPSQIEEITRILRGDDGNEGLDV